MKWQLQETQALQGEFSSILPTDGYRLSLFGRGPIALRGLVHFLNTIGPSLTKIIYAYFDRISYYIYTYMYIYIYKYIYIYITMCIYIYITMCIYIYIHFVDIYIYNNIYVYTSTRYGLKIYMNSSRIGSNIKSTLCVISLSDSVR